MKAVTRKIRAPKSVDQVPDDIYGALASLTEMLAADGYVLRISQRDSGSLVAKIDAGPDACADCLVPKAMMLKYFEDALISVCESGFPEIQIIYPGEQADSSVSKIAPGKPS